MQGNNAHNKCLTMERILYLVFTYRMVSSVFTQNLCEMIKQVTAFLTQHIAKKGPSYEYNYSG